MVIRILPGGPSRTLNFFGLLPMERRTEIAPTYQDVRVGPLLLAKTGQATFDPSSIASSLFPISMPKCGYSRHSPACTLHKREVLSFLGTP